MWKWTFLCLVSTVSAGLQKNFVNFGGFICPREDKALGRCLRDTLNTYIPKLALGLPEFDVPSCEPLHIPSITIKQNSGAIRVSSTYSDVSVRGPSHMRIKEVEVDAKKHKVVAKLHIPELKMKGKYKLRGQLLMLPIEGEGNFIGKYGDIDAIVIIKLGRKKANKGPDTLTCEQLDVKFHMGSARIQMDNLFGGDSDLGAAMNKFLNENWQVLAEELRAPMESALRDFLKPIGDHAFSYMSADEILLD